MFGYAGAILSVDLTKGAIERSPLARNLTKNFIGGPGINAKLAYDLIHPGIDPLSPENVLIFGAGPLIGTMAPTASKTSAIAKSPISGFLGISNAGHLGAMLKFAGYDHLIIKGKADKPCFLKIEDDKVEIRNAEHLWGKDIYEATDSLWDELGSDYWIACIGQAGENLVRFACILNNKHAAFGRTGLGAVMGSKNLKAIAVHGTKGIRVSNRGKFMRLINHALDEMLSNSQCVDMWRGGGTWAESLVRWEEGKSRRQQLCQRTKRMDTELLDPNTYWDKFKVASMSCFACPIGCKAWLEVKKGKYEGLGLGVSCTAATLGAAYGLTCGIPTWNDVAVTAQLGQRLGLDSINTAGIMYFVMELYENGIITREDTDGLVLEWGNSDAIQGLMRKIAYREGFGNTLADGVVEATRRIGKASEKYAYHIKGLTTPPEIVADLRAIITPQNLGCIVNPRGWHLDPFRFPLLFSHWDKQVEAVRRYAGHLGIPEDAMGQLLSEKGYNVALFTGYCGRYNLVLWSLGMCDRDVVCDALHINLMKDLYCAATGIETTSDELLKAGERIWNIERAFNVREGASRKDDAVPDKIFREPYETYVKTYPPLKREMLETLLDEYYEIEGWDRETGKPTKKRLEELGLEDVARDLEAL